MLWEFTSAITPSTVGCTAVAVLFIHKERISVGSDILFKTTLQGTGIALLNNLVFVAIAG
jgi:hypothetical protein